VRRFEAAVIHLLEEIAGDEDVLLHLAEESRHQVGDELPRLHRERDARRSSCELLAEQSTRMIEHFKDRKRVPKSVLDEFERMEQEMEAVRGDIGELEDRIGELESGAPDSAALGELLHPFIGRMTGLSLEDRKTVLQSVIGGIGVNRFEPSSTENDNYERPGGAGPRTRRLLLNITLKAAGSSSGRRPRTCAVIPCWGDLDTRKVADELVLHHGRPPQIVPVLIPAPPREKPRETAVERALRFQRMLTSGQVTSRADLARRLGVARSWVTQVLRHLPAA
jgi:hypothetical protein